MAPSYKNVWMTKKNYNFLAIKIIEHSWRLACFRECILHIAWSLEVYDRYWCIPESLWYIAHLNSHLWRLHSMKLDSISTEPSFSSFHILLLCTLDYIAWKVSCMLPWNYFYSVLMIVQNWFCYLLLWMEKSLN